MLIAAYCIPIFACLLLRFAFNFDGEWYAYMWTFIFGELTVGGLHYLFYRHRTSATEYLGAIVTGVEHENEWTELKEEKVRKTDSKGNSYEVTEIREIDHSEIYRFHTSLGHHYQTNSDFFFHVCRQWDNPLKHRSWTGSHIKYGIRHGQYKRFIDETINGVEDHHKYLPVSEKHRYTNKIINSNSIFNFEEISKSEASILGLYEFPAPDEKYDVPAILCRKFAIPENIDQLYRRFNALETPSKQLRLFILVFDADAGIAVADKQKSYWKGGNKNEIVICLGVNGKKQVKWAYTFSWAKENIVEVEIDQWFLEHPELDFEAFLAWFGQEYKKWERRQFKEFDYIQVNLQLWQNIAVIIGGIIMGILSIAISLQN